MNGEVKKVVNKAKQVANAANGNGTYKRRKGQDLKPIITTEKSQAQDAGATPHSASNIANYK